MQQRIRSAAELARFVEPSDDEARAIAALGERFRFVITPYYASLMDPADPSCPVRKQVVPRLAELDDVRRGLARQRGVEHVRELALEPETGREAGADHDHALQRGRGQHLDRGRRGLLRELLSLLSCLAAGGPI